MHRFRWPWSLELFPVYVVRTACGDFTVFASRGVDAVRTDCTGTGRVVRAVRTAGFRRVRRSRDSRVDV